MKWVKDTLANAKAILLAPITNVLCISGIGFVAMAFVDYDKANGQKTHDNNKDSNNSRRN